MPKLTKTTARKPAAKRTTRKKRVEITPYDVAARAYFIHLEEGAIRSRTGCAPSTNWCRR
jgi:hypothetical protein